ncbi:MAG TPA: hypothetical protein VHB27_09490 [Rhodopila sp.]|uniref:hypothetical protein n=1 Tax=Rhodopila sp. TaxID=2480087 RepID=UPI002B50A0DF|nr:hypothetical protein [Rhodopila sp.]HVY15451.1 hypothetical protein [Rhodopila sp.]
MNPNNEPSTPLSHAGSIIDKAIEYMISQNIGEIEIASALLGGSLAVLSRSMPDESIVGILTSAIDSVRGGELRRQAQ